MSYLRVAISATTGADHDHFEVWRHTANLPLSAVRLVASRVGTDVRDRAFADSGVQAGVKYWYWVRAIDKWGNASAFAALGSETAPVLNAAIATDRLLGRDAAGVGAVEEIAVTAPLAFDGGGAIRIEISAPGFVGRSAAGAGAADGLTVAAALTLLGFSDAIFDRAAPGAIGAATPAAGTFATIVVDSPTLAVDAVNHRVGIGTTTPQATLEVAAAGGAAEIRIANTDESVTSGETIGSISWNAPNEASGDDALLVGARIAALTDFGYGAAFNRTSLVFYTADSGTATAKAALDYRGYLGIGSTAPATRLDVAGAITQRPLSADPADPAVGNSVTWVSDGTGSGDAGDVMVKINVAGTVKTATLIDYSAV